MHRVLSVKLSDLNNFLKCPLCKGYFVDSFTINECLHSFCKSCIIKYIQRKECCPICKIGIRKEKLSAFIRRDVNLQCIVYKLVPGLFKSEMKRRRQFYSSHPKALKFLKKKNVLDKEAIGELDEDVFLIDNQTEISLSIEYSETGLSDIFDSARTKELDPDTPKTYLQCPSVLSIQLLKKFLMIKFERKSTKEIDIMYDDKPLKNELTLQDVAYIYAWRRTAPMRLFYRYNLTKVQSGEPVESPALGILAPIDANRLQQTKDCKQQDELLTEQEFKPTDLSVSKSDFELNYHSKCENITNGKLETQSAEEQKEPIKEENEENEHSQHMEADNMKENVNVSMSNETEVTKHDSKNESLSKENTSIRNSLLTSSSLNGQSCLNGQSATMMNSVENLTIAALVASIAQDKNFNNCNKLNKSLKSSTNSDKENEHEPEETSEPKMSCPSSNMTTTTTTATTKTNTTSTSLAESSGPNQPEKKLLNENTFFLNNDQSHINLTNDDSINKINAPIVTNLANVEAIEPLNLKVKKPKLIKPKKPMEPNGIDTKTAGTNVPSEKKNANVNKQPSAENPNKKMRPSESKKQLKAKANEEAESETSTTTESLNSSQASNQQSNLSQNPTSKTPNSAYNANSNSSSHNNNQLAQMPMMPGNFQLMPMSLMNHLMCANKQWNQHYAHDFVNQAGANYSNYQSNHQANSNPQSNANHNQYSQQSTERSTVTQLGNSNSGSNANNGLDFKTQMPLANAFLNPQKYASSLFDAYFQSKAQSLQQQQQQQQQHQQPQNFSHFNSNNPNMYNTNGHYNQSSYTNHHLNYNPSQLNIDEFKRPLSTFASLIQEAASYQSNLFNANKNYNQAEKLSNCSVESASAAAMGFDSLKETQLKISESCNLVNEST